MKKHEQAKKQEAGDRELGIPACVGYLAWEESELAAEKAYSERQRMDIVQPSEGGSQDSARFHKWQ